MACALVLSSADYRARDVGLAAAVRSPDNAEDPLAANDAIDPLPSSAEVADWQVPSPTSVVSAIAVAGLLRGDASAAQRDDRSANLSRDGRAAAAASRFGQLIRTVAGTVGTTFTSAALAAGAPESIVAQVADVLGWEIDFTRDLQPGAEFRLVYGGPELDADGDGCRLLAAQIEARGEWREAFYYSPDDARDGAYFDDQGRAIERRFLRYPVAFTRVSSRFSERRFHPVLKIHRPHYGVDFAAPTGTAVRAVAAGVVTKAGWLGGSGRFVKLEHDHQRETGYAHLSRIAPGIVLGAHVRKGQTIGYVGQSGLATGPHLHFALYVDGHYADPLKANLPRARSLHGARLAAFRAGLLDVQRVLAAAETEGDGEPIVTASAR